MDFPKILSLSCVVNECTYMNIISSHSARIAIIRTSCTTVQCISLIYHKLHAASMCFTVITCDALPVDNHGYYTNANCTSREQTYNDTCTLECHPNYTPNGDPVKTCQLDGTWNSSTRCIGKCHLDRTWSFRRVYWKASPGWNMEPIYLYQPLSEMLPTKRSQQCG